MNCKACGEPIPSHLLRKDSFSCPACGRAYYRGSKPAGASSTKSTSRATDKRASTSKPKAPVETPKWLMAAIAALLILVIAVGGVWVLTKRGGLGGSGISGTVSVSKLDKSKDQTVTVEIPRQRGNYMVVTESDQISVVFAVKEKTETSFNLVAHNLSSKARDITVSWALVPCKAAPAVTE